MRKPAARHFGTPPLMRGSHLMEHQLLHPKIGNLTDKQSAFAATVERVDRSEFLEQPSGTAEFAEDSSVRAHPVYLTRDIDIVPRIGIGNIQDRTGSLGDTHRLALPSSKTRS